DELDEILVPGEIAHEHGKVVGALVAAVLAAALGVLAGRDVELASQDRLDAGLLPGEIEVDAAEQVAVIGQRDRGELEVFGFFDELLELGGPVEQAVFGVDVE